MQTAADQPADCCDGKGNGCQITMRNVQPAPGAGPNEIAAIDTAIVEAYRGALLANRDKCRETWRRNNCDSSANPDEKAASNQLSYKLVDIASCLDVQAYNTLTAQERDAFIQNKSRDLANSKFNPDADFCRRLSKGNLAIARSKGQCQ